LFAEHRTNNKERASRQTHMQGNNNKKHKGQQHRNKTKNTNGKHAECDHVKKKKGREAESFKHMKINMKNFYTPEDGHVGRNM
jgi:hypothetical protein